MATYAAFKHVELHKIGYGKNRVPNAPRGRISEIFSGGDELDSHGATNGAGARNGRVARSPRDTPTRPRDTHSRLFGYGAQAPPPVPLVTDNVRSNIRFGDMPQSNGSASSSPSKSPLLNGTGPNTPSRGSAAHVPSPRNPVTGDGVSLPLLRRRRAPARSRGAYSAPCLTTDLTVPLPLHTYTEPDDWPPTRPPYMAHSAARPLPVHSVDPYTLLDLYEPPTLYKYEPYDVGPIPDYAPLRTPVIPGPHTLAGHPPILTRHAPGYLFEPNDWNDHTQTYFLNYARARQIEGNPITGDGYKSLNGEINTAVTALNGNQMPINHNRIPPGGYSSGLW